jgi:phosphatidylserine decarboxylase
MGRFSLGSTVVLLFTKQSDLQFNPRWAPQAGVRMGETMANVRG